MNKGIASECWMAVVTSAYFVGRYTWETIHRGCKEEFTARRRI